MVKAKHTPPTSPPRLALPYRGRYGAERPEALGALPLPPGPMPRFAAGRPLKRWRYVAFFSAEAMISVTHAHIGPFPDAFWAVWDRTTGVLRQGHGARGGRVALASGAARLTARRVSLTLAFAEAGGIETVCPAGDAYGWTRKQAGLPGQATLTLDGRARRLMGEVIVDDTAAYYPRRTGWAWSAGVGRSREGAAVAWNLVSGVNDPPQHSERSVWVDGVAHEPPPSRFAADLSGVDGLRFASEAILARTVELGLVASRYRQPFGTFTGVLPGGLELAHGLGVMERHDARW